MKEKIKNNLKNGEKTVCDRLDNIGWGIFFVMVGLLWIFPESIFPRGTWLIGMAFIIFGVAYVKATKEIRVDKFTLTVGAIAFVFGLGSIMEIELNVIPVFFLAVGLIIILKSMLDKRK